MIACYASLLVPLFIFHILVHVRADIINGRLVKVSEYIEDICFFRCIPNIFHRVS